MPCGFMHRALPASKPASTFFQGYIRSHQRNYFVELPSDLHKRMHYRMDLGLVQPYWGGSNFHFAKVALTPACHAFSATAVLYSDLYSASMNSLQKRAANSENEAQSVSVCEVAVLGFLKLCTSMRCCISANHSCIWPMPAASFSNLCSKSVKALSRLSWDWVPRCSNGTLLFLPIGLSICMYSAARGRKLIDILIVCEEHFMHS